MPKFPFTNYHELNLDWILKKVTALFDASEENAQTIRTYETRLTTAEQTATSAATAATSAETLASAAAMNANDALSIAGTADAKADSALTAATDAVGTVAGAMSAAMEAQQTAGAAVATANDAAATASSLESLANTANQNATAALETAQTADQKAVAAQTAATTADQKAVAAQSAATTNAGNISTLQTDVGNLTSSVENLTEEIDNKADVIIDSASGNIASFTDGADNMPIKSLIVNIDPVQSGSGNPSPTNIRPITGHTGCSVSRVGKNLLNQATRTDGYYIEWNGTIAAYPISCYSDYIPVEPSTIYTFSFNNTAGLTRRIAAYDKNKNWLVELRSQSVTEGAAVLTCTTTAATAFVRISYVQSDTDVQFEKGTNTSYEPFSENSISVSWQTEAGTVYGGTLDIISGTLTVTHFLYIFDGTEYFTKSTTALNGFWSNLNSVYPHNWPAMKAYPNVLKSYSSMFTPTSDVEQYRNNYGYLYLDSGVNFSSDPDVFGMTADSFKTKLAELYNAGTPVTVCTEIETPVVYQLTGQQLNTVLGVNNIYSNAGSVTVQYTVDIKTYIDSKIAELQALVLEN